MHGETARSGRITLDQLRGEGLGDSCRLVQPHDYNAAACLIDRHLAEGRGGKIAYIDDRGFYTYADLAARVNRAGNVLRSLGVQMEQRVMLCLFDGIDFLALFFGAVKIGAVPVPVNTLLKPADYDYMLRDSRAKVLVISAPLLEVFKPLLASEPHLAAVMVCGGETGDTLTAVSGRPLLRFDRLCAGASECLEPAATVVSDVLYWLYSSGTTGKPKGVVHRHGDIQHAGELLGRRVFGIGEDDVVFCASKLAFSYGLLCAVAFPLHVGATTVLMAERPTPEAVMRVMGKHQPTVFCAVPTLYSRILADPTLDTYERSTRLRFCVSAGEPLPEPVSRNWQTRFGMEILDGIGTTETLIIFLCNRAGDVRHGTSGRPVPGCEMRLLDADGAEVSTGEIGDLWVSTPSTGAGYWNNRPATSRAFVGAWFCTGDKYWQDADGYYHYAGRCDDMLKVGAIWVSPSEVESALMEHPDVLEAAVIGLLDGDGLTTPKAFVVLKDQTAEPQVVVDALRAFVKERLAPYKCPRRIEFREELPKTATGKIQRFKLRAG